jgi:hypothetical protein
MGIVLKKVGGADVLFASVSSRGSVFEGILLF